MEKSNIMKQIYFQGCTIFNRETLRSYSMMFNVNGLKIDFLNFDSKFEELSNGHEIIIRVPYNNGYKFYSIEELEKVMKL